MRRFISKYINSFSFRAGLLVFIILSAVFIVLRLLIYYQSIESATDEIRKVITAHAEGLDEGMKKYGERYLKDLINAIVEDDIDQDNLLVIAFRDEDKMVAGNLSSWPKYTSRKGKWVTFDNIDHQINLPDEYIGKLMDYPGHRLLLVGYNLQEVEQVESALVNVLIQNLIISLFISLLLSIGIIYLINRRLKIINQACEQVIHGDLAHRVPLTGGKDQFDSLAGNFNRMLDWITTLLQTIRDSANNLAHDMKTPLSRHRIKMQTILENSPNEKVREELSGAIKEVDILVEMFDSIMNIAKAEGRSGVEHFSEFNLIDSVKNVIDFYEPVIEHKSMHLSVKMPEQEVIKMKGDRHLITQAIANLLDNAVKYTDKKGSILIGLEKADDKIMISVSDSGPGIPEQYHERVKERFFRLDASRNTPGTGLGLSLVNAVAILHGGWLRFSDNNPGLKAELVLPLTA